MRFTICVVAAATAVLASGQALSTIAGPVYFASVGVAIPGPTVYATTPLISSGLYYYLSESLTNGGAFDDIHAPLMPNPITDGVTSITFGYASVYSGSGSPTLTIDLSFYSNDSTDTMGGILIYPFTLVGLSAANGVHFLTVNFYFPLGLEKDDWMGLHFCDYSSGVTDAGWLLADPVISPGYSHDLYVDGFGVHKSPWSGSGGPLANFDPIIVATPEPGAMAVLAMGLLGMIGRRAVRRRK